MLALLGLIACGPAKQQFDISSTIIVKDSNNQLVNLENVEICQTLATQNAQHKEHDSIVTQCAIKNIENGIVQVDNWEGKYLETDNTEVQVTLKMLHKEQKYTAELIDDDKDVWCDNDISVSHDRPECESTSFKLCQAGYELYMLWLLTLPAS